MFRLIINTLGFCNSLTKHPLNSINPQGESVAYGYYFPKQWDANFIRSQIDPTHRLISSLELIKSRTGLPTGKVLFRFVSSEAMDRIIERYNEDFVLTKDSAHRVVIKPFQLKTEVSRRQNNQFKTKNIVKVKNLDFDITVAELERIAKDYGEVKFIEMHIRPNGLNDGAAKIYFSKRKQAQDFYHFADGLLYKERKFTAELLKTESSAKQQLNLMKEPIFTIQANEKLYRRLLGETGGKALTIKE